MKFVTDQPIFIQSTFQIVKLNGFRILFSPSTNRTVNYKCAHALYKSVCFQQGCELCDRVIVSDYEIIMKTENAVNPDLIAERKKCTFNTLELTHLLDGGAKKTEERRSRGTYELCTTNQTSLFISKLLIDENYIMCERGNREEKKKH